MITILYDFLWAFKCIYILLRDKENSIAPGPDITKFETGLCAYKYEINSNYNLDIYALACISIT